MRVRAESEIRTGHRARLPALPAHLAVLGVFIVLSVVMTYPLITGLGSRILGAPAPDDNFEYLQKVWWFKHALFDLHVNPFFDPSVFYPFGFSLVLVETTLSNVIPALPLTIFFGEVVAYNLTLLLSFVLSGFATYLLVLNLGGSRMAGVLSGVIFAFCPYRMAHLGAGHLPLMSTQWLPLLLLYLDRMIARQRTSLKGSVLSRDAVMGAVFYALGALSSWYYAYMFALAGIVYVLLRGRPWRQHLWQRSFMRTALIFGLVSLLLVGPFVLPVTRLAEEGSRPQSLRYLDYFSASILDFIYPNVMHPLWGTWLLKSYAQNVIENTLYLGLVPLVLAIAALSLKGHAQWPQQDRIRKAVAGLSVVFVVLALGTTLHWGTTPITIPVPGWVERVFTAGMGFLTKRLALYPISSYSLRTEGAIYLPLPTLLLYLYLPFFNGMRVWARFGLIVVLGVSVLAGLGFQQLLDRIQGQLAKPRCPKLRGRVLLAIVLLLILFEFAAIPFAMGTCSTQARPVDHWLAAQEGDFAIMEFPVAKAMTGRAMYMMRTHGKRITSGQSTFFPQAFVANRPVLESFPSQDCLALLKSWGVRYVLVGSHSYGAAWPQLERDLAAASISQGETQPALRHVITLDDLPIYEGDRVLRMLPRTEQAFIIDRIYVYEVL